MNKRRLIESFMTHRLSTKVVLTLATGRTDELAEIMTAVDWAMANPGQTPQHLMIYGERGSGKSFLMRLVEIKVAGPAPSPNGDAPLDEGAKLPSGPLDSAVRSENESASPMACALLPEEHHNIRYAHQLLKAVTSQIKGHGWGEVAFRFLAPDKSEEEAWAEARADLWAALDQRFGPGRGLVLVLVENFDKLVKDLFGAGGRPVKKPSPQESARRSAEERLRHLLNDPQGRFMLIGGATGTVDLDYDRPLFMAFKPVQLSQWSPDSCLEYFDRRRDLEGLPALTKQERHRALAIAEFTGGNPRLVQLLGEAISSPDAYTIADILDALSDQLADYYRRRLDDLPPNAAGVLDALIRLGEPRTQTELAEMMGTKQKHIGDAFGFLIKGCLLSAEQEIKGSGTLYKVRDRLFVHFYRRRYNNQSEAEGLAPIAELLENFYTVREREKEARESMEQGRFHDAGVFLKTLPEHRSVGAKGYCPYRDGYNYGPPDHTLFILSGLSEEECKSAQIKLKDDPSKAVKYWHDRAFNFELPLLARIIAFTFEALALSRCGLDEEALKTLETARKVAEDADDLEAQILILRDLSIFWWNRKEDKSTSIEMYVDIKKILKGPVDELLINDHIKIQVYYAIGFYEFYINNYEESNQLAHKRFELAQKLGLLSAQCSALLAISNNYFFLGEYQKAVDACERGLKSLSGNPCHELQLLRRMGRNLIPLGEPEKALEYLGIAIDIAEQFSLFSDQSICLMNQVEAFQRLDDHTNALASCDEFIALAIKHDDITDVLAGNALKIQILCNLARSEEAMVLCNESIRMAVASEQPFFHSWLLCEKSEILKENGETEDALKSLDAASEMAKSDNNSQTYDIFFQESIGLAVQIPWLTVVDNFEFWLARPDLKDKESFLISQMKDVLTAVGRAGQWASLLKCIQKHQLLFSASPKFYCFNGIADLWLEWSREKSRSELCDLMSTDMPIMVEIMSYIASFDTFEFDRPDTDSSDIKLISPDLAEKRQKSHLTDLVDRLLAKADRSSLLWDLADIIERNGISEFDFKIKVMRAMAEYLETEDQAKFLQRMDPDLATAIRRMRDLPDPVDVLDKRRSRRKKA